MKQFKNIGGVTFLVILTSLFLQSCIQSPKSNKSTVKSASTNTSTKNTDTKLPTFANGNNFFQNGGNVYTASVTLDLKFSDSLQLRGKDIDGYIRNTGTTNVACLAAKFPNNGVGKVIVLAAIPRSTYITATETREYYYSITPSDSTNNTTFCQKTGLINALYDSSNLTPKYLLSEICPTGTCAYSSYISSPLELYSSSGTLLSQLAVQNLTFNVSNLNNGGSTVGTSCTESSQCTSQGYDCCSSGQCVINKALKPGINTDPAINPDYAQALQDILNNPTNIINYPQFYFLCSDVNAGTPTTPTSPDPLEAAVVRLKHLADLYSCTNKIEGEYGVCSKTIENAVKGSTYEGAKDDRSFVSTFTNSTYPANTLVAVEKVYFGDILVYDYSTKTILELQNGDLLNSYVNLIGSQNDNLTSGTNIYVKDWPVNAKNKNITVKYKIDASCVEVNKNLARCDKYYVQGQKDGGSTPETNRWSRVTDHYVASNIFKIPENADISKAITVNVDGVVQKVGVDWNLVNAATPYIQFISSGTLKVSDGQKVKITYYVNNPYLINLMASKAAALNEIKTVCGCTDLSCTLTPIKNSADAIVDYACVFPEPPAVEPPMSQKIYLSSKTVPLRYFDEKGSSQGTVNASTAKQEKHGDEYFKYTNDNLLTPNNLTNYTGFSEIYGNLTYSNNSAKPAQEVNVKKGTIYDIYVDRGSFSNCVQCGNDYYSQLNKLFPLTQFGGGATPLLGQTNRTMTTGIRSDDMKFGRACHVPATMIPWSHGSESTVKTQRLNRMSTQHFYYANGYQYDWYGFDYGAVIGSFDGVKWFAIGSNRRIKAESNKMFIAVNGAMGDLTVESTYEVSVYDGSLNPVGSNLANSDYDSDGAQCQQFHMCSTDNDCATTLGWEYACAPVGEITTTWPKFDDNAQELAETMSDNNRFTAILGISSSAKRCVYRGRGALCSPNYASINVNNTFNQSTNPAMHACAQNSYCQPVLNNGSYAPKFNNRIARYGKVRTTSTEDIFGMAAKVPGRPLAWLGQETVRTEALKNININRAHAMCIPGRDVEQTSFIDQNRTAPLTGEFDGDKILGIGMTFRKNTPTAAANYLNACSIMDNSKNFYQHTATNPAATFNTTNYPTLKLDAGSQALSTNLLNQFNAIFTAKNITFGLYKDNASPLQAMAFTENRCMRAPGSSCFTDLDCAPSKTITDKIKSLSSSDTVVTNILNAYEVKFWQEELVCSQDIAKDSTKYDPKNNRCCRALGNTISLPSASTSNGLDMTKVPGIDYSVATVNRYSRAATMYKETNTLDLGSTSSYPELRVAVKDQCQLGTCQTIEGLDNQWRTFAAFAEKTSCTGDWVRNFAIGGHKWDPARFQKFQAKMFQCMNWLPGTGIGTGYTCDSNVYDVDDPTCPIIQTQPNNPKAKEIFNYLGKLELMGIPQIALESNEFFSQTTEQGFSCKSDPDGRTNAYPNNPLSSGTNYRPPKQLFAATNYKEYTSDTSDATNAAKQLFSAVDNTNFQNMQMVFKADEVSTCMPAGTKMNAGDDPSLCCTGMINSENLKCQLPDYVDLSIYTNRYVSSEGKKLSPTLFDKSGYIKDPSNTAILACEKSMCASGSMAYGVLISRLRTPGQTESGQKPYRFLEGHTATDDESKLLTLFNMGLKINTHIYCIPKNLASQTNASQDLTIINCAN